MLERTGPDSPELALLGERPTRVALTALPPVYAHGLSLGLAAAGLDCRVVADLAHLPGLLAEVEPLVVVLPERRASAVLPLRPVPGAAEHAVVLILDAATPQTYADGLRAGATGLITPESALDEVVQVVRCASRGQTLLPQQIARALCRPHAGPAPALDVRERTWLRRLAAGTTVAGLARSSGYSEREMYRLLSSVYTRLGASNRTEALLLAERWGLLDPE